MAAIDQNKLLLYWSNEISAEEKVAIERNLKSSPESLSLLSELEELKSEFQQLPLLSSNRDFVTEALEANVSRTSKVMDAVFGPGGLSLALGAAALTLFWVSSPGVDQSYQAQAPTAEIALDISHDSIEKRLAASRKRILAVRQPRRHVRLVNSRQTSRGARTRNVRRRISILRDRFTTERASI